MVSTDKFSKLVALPTALPALLVALLLYTQWRSTACTFNEAAPGSGLLLCRQRLLGWELQTALVRVERREGWLWGRRKVGGHRGGPGSGCSAPPSWAAVQAAKCPCYATPDPAIARPWHRPTCSPTNRRWTTGCLWTPASPTPCFLAATPPPWRALSAGPWRRPAAARPPAAWKPLC